MKPYYWESQHGNFGDDLNLWLWDFLLPGFRDAHPDTLLVGVGTVLNTALLPADGHKLVLGSGYGYGALPDMSDRSNWDVRCVRGPLTAERAGLSADMGIVDPAVMVADMPEFQDLPKIHRKSFVPHWETAIAGIWPMICETVGLHYIDPRGEAKQVIRAIRPIGNDRRGIHARRDPCRCFSRAMGGGHDLAQHQQLQVERLGKNRRRFLCAAARAGLDPRRGDDQGRAVLGRRFQA